MSAKWRRSKAWDDEHLTGALLPVKWLLRWFSSVPSAVILLLLVALYGILASVPIGLLSLIPTQLFYGATFLFTLAIIMGPGMWLLVKLLAGRGSFGTRFVLQFLAGMALFAIGAALWSSFIWPAVRYIPADPVTGRLAAGVRFFSTFSYTYRGTVLRQLPSWELSEIEFYAWWPFKLVLILFVVNMIMATVRRIEFKWLNIGVLSVHSGLVTLAIGSVYYDLGKVEGSILLWRDGNPETYFYDNIIPALYVWDESNSTPYQQELPGLARYNNAVAGSEYAPNIPIHADPKFTEKFTGGIEMNIVGIIPYGNQMQTGFQDGGSFLNPSVEMSFVVRSPAGSQTVWTERLFAMTPAQSTQFIDIFSLQYLVAPTEKRRAELTAEFPEPGDHMILVRIPGSDFESKYVVTPGDTVTVGETGWSIEVTAVQAFDEGLSIITRGYQGSASSRIRMNLTAPDGALTNRSVMHRFPELTQDFHPTGEGQMPRRTPPDPAIEITYIDATRSQVFIVQENPGDLKAEFIRREPGGIVTMQAMTMGEEVTIQVAEDQALLLAVGDAFTHSRETSAVIPVPKSQQERNMKGNYSRAYLDVAVTYRDGNDQPQTMRKWVPFVQYLDTQAGFRSMTFDIPGQESMQIGFAPLKRRLPNIALKLIDFKMTPYPGTDTPRDYASTLQVYELPDFREGTTHITQLNRPYVYRVPFTWRDDRNFIANSASWLRDFIKPMQYKFSQSGWDPENQAYTILGVGNNPGIYLIAFGGILMCLGVPWAFYVKPAIQRRRKRRIQRELAAQAKEKATACETTTTEPKPTSPTSPPPPLVGADSSP